MQLLRRLRTARRRPGGPRQALLKTARLATMHTSRNHPGIEGGNCSLFAISYCFMHYI